MSEVETANDPENTGIIRDEEGRFIKGYSGNPRGRPEGTISLLPLLKRELIKVVPSLNKDEQITYAEALIKKMLKKAIAEEDVQMIKDIFNRVDGMPKQKLGIGMDEDNNVTKLTIEVVKNKEDVGNKTKDDNSL